MPVGIILAEKTKPGIIQILRQQSDDRLRVIKPKIQIILQPIHPPSHPAKSINRNEPVSITDIHHRTLRRTVSPQRAIIKTINRLPRIH